MKSELSFLLELILDETTPKPIKAKLVKRVQDVEKNYTTHPVQNVPRGTKSFPQMAVPNVPIVAVQSPSMQKMMANNPDLIPQAVAPITPAVPVTPQAAQALQARQQMIFNKKKKEMDVGKF